MRSLVLSLLIAACSSSVPGGGGAGIPPTPADAGPGTGGTATPTPAMAVGDPAPVAPHPDGADGMGRALAGSDLPTMELDGCTVYTEPGATEAIATVVRHADGEALIVDTMPYTRVLGAEACPAAGPDALRVESEAGYVGIFYGRTAREHTSLFTVAPTQMGGVLSVFDEADGELITSAGFWDGDLTVVLEAPNTLVYDRFHGDAAELGVDCSADPDGEPPFVVERTRLDLDTRTTDGEGLRCIQ